MIADAKSINEASIGAAVCVVGAGPAGLAVARELAECGIDTLVLEAGGAAYDRHNRRNLPKVVNDHARGAQSLTRGRTSGDPYYPLRLSRARGVAGTTNALLDHGLRGRPLDTVDFEDRLGTGWPISYDEVFAHVSRAEAFVGMRIEDDAPIAWNPSPPDTGAGVWRDLVAAPFRHGRRRHVAGWASQLGGAAHLRLLTKANVVGFIHRSGRISAVEVALPDRTLVVHADVFVLAVGGIDNPRLLLNSRPVLAAMGDAARNVGRFFMEHLHFVPAYLEPSDPDGLTAMVELFGDHSGAAHWVTPADDVVRRHDLLRVGLAGVPIHPSSIDPAVSAFGELVRIFPFGPWSLQQRVRQAARIASGATAVASAITARMRREPRNALAIAAMGEQAPYSESSITLGPGSDRFGVPLAGLDWRIASHEIDAVRRTTELLAGEVERAGVGRVVSIWDQGLDRPDLITGGWHHMGTTRMGADPSTSVVDGDCKVHGLDNLYMGGSSVFATGGYANPTLTLVALAIRLGRHLAGS